MSLVFENVTEEKILAVAESSLLRLGYEIVRVRLTGQDNNKILQVMIDHVDNSQVTINDCEKASTHLSALLDVEDVIDGYYNLEVSSPGLDRPLTRAKDFKRFIGDEAKVETKELINGQRRFRGEIKAVTDNDDIVLLSNVVNIGSQDEKTELVVPFNAIMKARLVYK